MMELQLGMVSDYAYVGDNGKLFILGEFRYIFASKLPAVHRQLFLTFRVVGLKVEGYEHKLKIDLTDADGASILPRAIEATSPFQDVGPAEVGRIQVQGIIEINGARFPSWGDYSFQLFVDGRHVGSVPLTVAKPPSRGQKKKRSR